MKVTVVSNVHNLVKVLVMVVAITMHAKLNAQLIVWERVDIPVNVMSAQIFAKEVVMAHVMLLVKHHQLVMIQ